MHCIASAVRWRRMDPGNSPAASGVYAIRSGARWLYIGKAADIAKRVTTRTHPLQITADLTGLSYWWAPAGDDRHRLEGALLRWHEPEWNGGTTFDRCSDPVHGPRCAYLGASNARMLAAITG